VRLIFKHCENESQHKKTLTNRRKSKTAKDFEEVVVKKNQMLFVAMPHAENVYSQSFPVHHRLKKTTHAKANIKTKSVNLT